jgi:2-acylglycerol O-acyltransferase 2
MANDPGSFLWKLQRRFQKMFGFTLPLFYGRGLLNCRSVCFNILAGYWSHQIHLLDNFGLIPYRRPIITVGENVRKCHSYLYLMYLHSGKTNTHRKEAKADHGGGRGCTAAVHTRADAVWLSTSDTLLLFLTAFRIWDTYKDSFARYRKKELQIVDWNIMGKYDSNMQ